MSDADRQRTVIIAGATGRTGPTVVRTFLQAGYQVIAVGRDESRLSSTLERIPGGERVLPAVADLVDPGQVQRVVDRTLERFGRVNAMVDLAQSGAGWRPFGETTLDDLRKTIEGGLYTAYNLCHAVVPPMLAQGEGYIVTVAGGSASDPGYGRGLFGATKAAVVTMTKGIARDYKAQGIRANCLVAGTIATDAARGHLSEEDFRAAATMQEFADALQFLASPAASGLSGAAVELNGREVD
jgi:NAD(P)-dependent dehydrogenase (short-subunit alcohol dehydrogenase family)